MAGEISNFGQDINEHERYCCIKNTNNYLAQYEYKIGEMLSKRDVPSEESLPEGYSIDKMSDNAEVKEDEHLSDKKNIKKEIKNLEKDIKADAKRLEILKNDYTNGTANGASIKRTTKQQRALNWTMGTSVVLGTIGTWVLDVSVIGSGGLMAMFAGGGLLGGMLAAVAIGGAVAGGIALYNRSKRKNPESEIAKNYTEQLPQLIKEQEAKLNEEIVRLEALYKELGLK